jgi:transcriptional regulator with XRE-family HTH domain
MTMAITAGPRPGTCAPGVRCELRRRHPPRRHPRGLEGDSHDTAVNTWHGRSAARTGGASLPIAPAGVIGGAVLTAVRRSAGISRRTLARNLGISLTTVEAWETGTLPLYRVSYYQLRHLAEVLRQAGAQLPPDPTDLVLASQCDLLVGGMLGGFEDYAEVPPIDHGSAGHAARALLRWALTGDVPEQYRAHAQPRPLLASRDIAAFTAVARDVADGLAGPELTGYGTALLAMAAT